MVAEARVISDLAVGLGNRGSQKYEKPKLEQRNHVAAASELVRRGESDLPVRLDGRAGRSPRVCTRGSDW